MENNLAPQHHGNHGIEVGTCGRDYTRGTRGQDGLMLGGLHLFRWFQMDLGVKKGDILEQFGTALKGFHLGLSCLL